MPHNERNFRWNAASIACIVHEQRIDPIAAEQSGTGAIQPSRRASSKGSVRVPSPFQLDAADWRLVAALQADASLTNAALAERVGLSASQISRRRQRLEETGIIRGYRAILDAAIVGFPVTAFITVTLASHDADRRRRFRDWLRATSPVLEAHALSGRAEILVKVAAADLAQLTRFVTNELLALDNVAGFSCEIVLETIKAPSPLPLNLSGDDTISGPLS
jgi:DNA-binding Lrp family transcriptional regulator